VSVSGATLAQSSGRAASVVTFCIFWILGTSVAGALGWLAMVVIGYGTMGCGMVLVWLVVGGLVGLAEGAVLGWYLGASIRPRSWVRPWFDRLSGRGSEDKAGDRAEAIASSASIAVSWAVVCAVAFLLCLVSFLIWWPGQLALLSEPWRALLWCGVGGVFYGIVQCSFLDLGLGRALVWVAFAAAGWALGATTGTLLGEPIAAPLSPDSGYGGIIMGPRDFALLLAQGSIGATVYSIVTALPVALLLRSSKQVNSS
jgi:hypothetical protein